jgi:hypothetical protein
MRWDHRLRSGSSTRPPPPLRPPSPCTPACASGKEEGKVSDPKDGVSRGVEGCTEAEEVEVGRIDRMDVRALAAALPML